MGVLFLLFKRWIGSLIPCPAYVKWFNSCCPLPLFLSYYHDLSLSLILSHLRCIFLISRGCLLIPNISLRWATLLFRLLMSPSYKLSAFHRATLFQIFFLKLFQSLLQVEYPLIKTRRGLHSRVRLTKPSSRRWITCSAFSISPRSFHIHPWLSRLSTPKWNEPQTDCV